MMVEDQNTGVHKCARAVLIHVDYNGGVLCIQVNEIEMSQLLHMRYNPFYVELKVFVKNDHNTLLGYL